MIGIIAFKYIPVDPINITNSLKKYSINSIIIPHNTNGLF